jgi:Tfp pilus assembly protein FimT
MKRLSLKTNAKQMPYGFTIAELLAVIILITLIAGMGGGIYVGTYRKMLVGKAADDILLAAKYARILAIEKQKPCRMEFDLVNNGFQLTLDGFENKTRQSESVTIRDLYFKPVQFSGDVKIEDIQIIPFGSESETDSQEQTEIVFQPNGTAQFAVITVGDGKTYYTVSISAATGKVKMYPGTAENIKIGTVDLDAQQ